MSDFYAEDLAIIHASAFEGLAEAAARAVMEERAGIRGHVIDLGCGAGRLSIELSSHGFRTYGIDLSSDLINIARDRLPDGEFACGSLLDVPFPSADVVVAVGEVFNYATAKSAGDLARVLDKARDALKPGGLLLFDVAAHGRVGAGRAFSEGNDWAVGMVADEEGDFLTRRITTFRRSSDNWRRAYETHVLRLWAPDRVLELLKAAGFDPLLLRGYAGLELPPGLHAYRAVKKA